MLYGPNSATHFIDELGGQFGARTAERMPEGKSHRREHFPFYAFQGKQGEKNQYNNYDGKQYGASYFSGSRENDSSPAFTLCFFLTHVPVNVFDHNDRPIAEHTDGNGYPTQ